MTSTDPRALAVRPARTEDAAGIARIATANGQPLQDSGADPRYLAHLTGNGHVIIAEAGCELAGFAATRQLGRVTLLCDLFVDPARHGGGIGRRLLDRAFDGATDRVTFSSQDRRALPLYARYGLAPRWPLLYLAGNPARLARDPATAGLSQPATARRAAVPDAAAAEQRLTGLDRAADYRYWAADGSGLIIEQGKETIAAGATAGAALQHLVVAGGADPAAALFAALPVLESTAVRLCLPGPHPALGPLLQAGFLIEDFDHYMSTSDGLVHASDVLSPALA